MNVLIMSLIVVLTLLVVAGLACLVWRLLRRRRSTDPVLDQSWRECRAAVEGSPWWLVLGASGSGKSGLLGESGLAWNLRPAAGAVNALPRLWRHDGGGLIELPGAWVEQPAASDGWLHWLARVRQVRRRGPPCGVIACIPLSDLLRKGPTWISATAAALHARGAELADAIGSNPPLYIVLTKADHIGGYKDFFAGLAEVERQQVLGMTFPWPMSGQPAAAWQAEHRALVEALRARRPLGLMRARDGEAARKMFQFPAQLEGLVQPVGDLVGQLVRPGREGCLLRGVYLSSCHRAVPTALPLTMRGERTDLERSVYLGSGRAAPSTGGAGHFSHALLARVLPEDRQLARPTHDRRRSHQRVRIVATWILPIAAAACTLWLLYGTWRSASLIANLRHAASETLALERLHPEDTSRNLDALDRLGAALARLAAHDVRAVRPAVGSAGQLYVRRLGEICANRAMHDLATEIVRLRALRQADTDRLYDTFRAYQMMAGAIAPEPAVLLHELGDSRRWYLAIERPDARLDWTTEVLAKRQLERLARELLPRGIGKLPADAGLVEATARELGESLWIRQGWDEILREARSRFGQTSPSPQIGVVLPGAQPEAALSRHAWDAAVADLVDEKSAALERTLHGLSITLDRDAIRRRLTERFRSEHRRAWLALISGVRVVETATPAELPARIAEAAGPGSSWPSVVRRALDELDPPSGLASLTGTARAPWARPSLDPLLALRADVESYLTVSATGTSEVERTVALAKRYDEAYAAASMRLAEVQPDDLRDALRAGLGGVVRGLWIPIDRSAAARLEQDWRIQVLPVWKRDCAGRFPFAEAAEEVPLARFSAFANPLNGVLWRGMSGIDKLRAQPVAGHPALTVSRAYLEANARAAAIRDGFFAGGGEQVVAPCRLTLVQREGITDLAIGCGSQVVRLYDKPDASYDLTLRQGEPGGAKVAIRVVTGEWKTLEFANREWGWLRLLKAGQPHAAARGGWSLTWPFDGSAAGSTVVWRAQALLEGQSIGEAVAGDLLTGFQPPEHLVAEQESP